MRDFKALKNCLTQIQYNNYNIPKGIDMDGLINDMLTFIGHADQELRDKLIYSTFYIWADNSIISTTQMQHILTTCLGDKYLFFGIGEKDTDSVFTRAFSSLAIALAFFVHEKIPFLTMDDVQGIKHSLLHYISQEKDYRGYVDDKGWAHATAHIADALGGVADCKIDGKFCFQREALLEILQAVKHLACIKDCVYTAEEDERLVSVVNAVCCNNILTNDDLIGWIDSFAATINQQQDMNINDYYLQVNHKHFLRSLYFNFLSCNDEFDTVDTSVICKHLLTLLV